MNLTLTETLHKPGEGSRIPRGFWTVRQGALLAKCRRCALAATQVADVAGDHRRRTGAQSRKAANRARPTNSCPFAAMCVLRGSGGIYFTTAPAIAVAARRRGGTRHRALVLCVQARETVLKQLGHSEPGSVRPCLTIVWRVVSIAQARGVVRGNAKWTRQRKRRLNRRESLAKVGHARD